MNEFFKLLISIVSIVGAVFIYVYIIEYFERRKNKEVEDEEDNL